MAAPSQRSADDYDTVSDNIYTQISRNLLPNDDDVDRFAPRGTAKQVMHDENLCRIFRSLIATSTPLRDTLREGDFVRKINERSLHDILAVIIYGSCGVNAVLAFAAKLVVRNDLPTLPLMRDQCMDLFDDNAALVRKYRDAQPIFCTIVIGNPHALKIKDPREWRYPYLSQSYINGGSYGEVYAVKIAANHLITETEDGPTRYGEVEVARKDYMLKPQESGNGEYDVINAILSSRINCKNIVESFGSLEFIHHDKPVYSLFMPLAKYDLQKYMEEEEPDGPQSVAERAELLWSAVGLAEGLEFLHYKMLTIDRKAFICYHMDLKPANILIFKEKDRLIWKLSDFGMSRVKFFNEVETNFDQPFIKQSTSKTRNRRMEGTYLAPEAQASTPRSGTESDVWSLGAIISTLLTYLTSGKLGVDKYTSVRNEYKGANGYDYFFMTSDSKRFEQARRHPMIARWHKKLVDAAKKRDSNEAKIISDLLGYIDNSVLVINPDSRARSTDAKVFVRTLEAAYIQYQKLAEPPSSEVRSPSLGSGPLRTNSWNPFNRDHGRPQCITHVSRWTMDISGFKGCCINADATLAAYWTDTTIHLCTAQMLSNASSSGALDNGPHFAPKIEEAITWKDICLTEDLLVATTNQDNFQCYVFDLKRRHYVEPSLERYTVVNVDVCPVPQNLALSDDGKWLACVTSGRKTPLRLRWILVDELLAYSNTDASSISSPSSSSHPSVTSRDPFSSVSLYPEVGQVTNLDFSAKGYLHMAFRPKLTSQEKKHQVKFSLFRLNPVVRLDERTTADGGNNDPVGFLTAFTPLNTQCAFAMITRERKLWIQPFQQGAQVHFYQHDVPNFRIVQIIVDEEDKAIYAFATGERKDKLQLLRISVPTRDIKPSPALIAELPGLKERDRFVVALSRGEGPRHMLIATQLGLILKLIVAK